MYRKKFKNTNKLTTFKLYFLFKNKNVYKKKPKINLETYNEQLYRLDDSLNTTFKYQCFENNFIRID